ncbi:MAG: hypothetical protein ACFFCQ_13810 [Promethearchaeota archaeon]
MTSIKIKYLRCGCKHCACLLEGKLHGPFAWLVSDYQTAKKENKEEWRYLGRSTDAVYHNLQMLEPYNVRAMARQTLQKQLEAGIREIQKAIDIFPHRSISREVMQINAE